MMSESFENKLTAALAEYQKQECAQLEVEAAENPHVFSERFERKMKYLLRSKSNVYYRLFGSAFKKAAVLTIAALIISFSAAMSIQASRRAIFEFFIKIYETFSVVFFTDSTVTPRNAAPVIEVVYEPSYIPEGYELVERNVSGTYIKYKYSNGNGEDVSYMQVCADSDRKIIFDTEDEKVYCGEINGKQYNYSIRKELIKIVWQEHDYVFQLLGYDLDELIKMMTSLTISN